MSLHNPIPIPASYYATIQLWRANIIRLTLYNTTTEVGHEACLLYIDDDINIISPYHMVGGYHVAIVSGCFIARPFDKCRNQIDYSP